MSILYLPDELIINILSFLQHKFINYKFNKKCICRTQSNRMCKVKTRHLFCHFHRDMSLAYKLSYSQQFINHKCLSCNKVCINNNNFCSVKCQPVCSQKIALIKNYRI